jgi:DNA-binding transcriptional ArsR family regulator
VNAYGRALHALADETRRSVFERLRAGPCPVGELAKGIPVSRPAVSQHLRVLREAKLVRERREGNRRVYSVDPEGLLTLRDYLDDRWGEVLAAFKSATEREAKGDGDDKRE